MEHHDRLHLIRQIEHTLGLSRAHPPCSTVLECCATRQSAITSSIEPCLMRQLYLSTGLHYPMLDLHLVIAGCPPLQLVLLA